MKKGPLTIMRTGPNFTETKRKGTLDFKNVPNIIEESSHHNQDNTEMDDDSNLFLTGMKGLKELDYGV